VTCLLERDTIQPYDIPFFLRSGKEAAGGAVRTSLEGVMDAAEKDAIVSALASAGNNKTAAAALLRIHRTHLYKKMKKYGL
jgi:transcriptional regulator with PAS, ATPase and Fis domain